MKHILHGFSGKSNKMGKIAFCERGLREETKDSKKSCPYYFFFLCVFLFIFVSESFPFFSKAFLYFVVVLIFRLTKITP